MPSTASPRAHPQVQDGLRALQEERDQVFQAWSQKQERLKAAEQEELLLRQCQHLEKVLTAQEAGSLGMFPLTWHYLSSHAFLSSRVFGIFFDMEHRGCG